MVMVSEHREDAMKKKRTLKTKTKPTKEAGFETHIPASDVVNMQQPNPQNAGAIRERYFGLGAIWNQAVEKPFLP